MTSIEPPSERLGDFTTNPRVLVIAAIAVVVSTAGVGAGVGLLALIRFVTNLAFFGRLSLQQLPIASSPLGLWTVLVPVAGALVVGLMARYGSEKIRGHGIPEAIEAILLGRSRLDAKVAVLKPLSSAVAIGTGGPFGAEGPIIMTGGALGSLIAQMLPVSDSERKTLLVAGAAAGMTTVFGTPIAAIMLAVELLLFEWTPRSFIPVCVAAIVAAVERSFLHMPSPLFPFAGDVGVSLGGLGAWVLVGLLAGLLSGMLTRLVYACEDFFLKLPVHWMWWPMLGGLVVGIGGLLEPQALGVGYQNIARMLQGAMLPGGALLLLLVKALVWSVALGSGTSGGVLAPLLIVGGAMGAVAGGFLPGASPGFWPLLAMAATMGGTMRAPLTATFFAVELTGNTHVLLPLIAACGTAHAVTVLLMRRSILTEKIARRGHHLVREYRIDPFAVTRVQDVMTREVESVPAAMTLHDAARFLTHPATRHPSFPVLEQNGRVIGVVDPPAVIGWRRAGKHRKTPLGELLVGARFASAYSDEYLDVVADRMSAVNTAHLPVVGRDDGRSRRLPRMEGLDERARATGSRRAATHCVRQRPGFCETRGDRAPVRPLTGQYAVSRNCALDGLGHRRVLERSHDRVTLREDPAPENPALRILVHRPRIGLEHDALAGAEAARVHDRMKALRELFEVVMRVTVSVEVDVGLCAAQGRKIPAHVFGVGALGDHHGHHEARIEHFAEAELLEEIVGPREDTDSRNSAVDELLHPAEQQAVAEGQFDPTGLEKAIERFERRVVAAGLKADGDRYAGEILGPLDPRIRCHENAAGRDRIGVDVKPAVPGRRRHVHGPVTGAAHVACPAPLERLVGADRVAEVMLLRIPRFERGAELVIEAFRREIALLLGDPFLEAHVRGNDELRHLGFSV